MPRVTFYFNNVGALFLNGATSPELRAPSIRGQLRYWLRAVVGAENTNLKQVWERECAVFGSTGQGSTVTVRMLRSEKADFVADRIGDAYMLPHRSDPKKQSPASAIEDGTEFQIDALTKPGIPFPADFFNAVSTWLLLGGLGKRSRRMMGGLQVAEIQSSEGVSIPEWWGNAPAEIAPFIRVTKAQLAANLAGKNLSPIPPPAFPVLHPDHAWVVVGQQGFDSAEEVNRRVFRDVLRKPPFTDPAKEFMFGYARGGRRASPLIAQVRYFDEQFYPVFTVMRSAMNVPRSPDTPPSARVDWDVLNDFMTKAMAGFKGVTVFGGPLK